LKLIEQVRHQEPARPRSIDGRIPRDLETIVLKAIDKDPRGRYPTAAALGEDLHRFVEDRPIRARRISPAERLWRWARRNRAIASLLTLLAIVLVGGFAATSLLWVRAERRAEDLRRHDYIGRVNLALSECLSNNVTRALELLDGCPTILQGWEWHYAWRQCHLELATFPQQAGLTLNGVAFSPDGMRVASVSGAFFGDKPSLRGDLVVRDVATGKKIFARPDVASGFRGVAYSPDGRWIATGNASDLVLWDAATGKEELRLPDPGNRDLPLLSLAYSPDGRRIIAGYGRFNERGVGHANLWDLTRRTRTYRISGHRASVHSVAFSPDGREVALGSSEGLVEVCDVEASARPIRALRGSTDLVYAVAFSPDGQYLATGGLGRVIQLWDRATSQEIRPFFGHEGFVRALAFSPDSQWLLSASEDRSLRLWEVATGRPLATYHGHLSHTSCVAFSPDGQLAASGGQDHAVKLWLAKRRPPLTFTGHDGKVCGLEFLPDSQRLVSGAGDYSTRGRLQLWDATTGDVLEPSFASCPGVQAVVLRPDGRHLATGCMDGTVRVWDLGTGRLVWCQNGHATEVADVAYSPDGRWLASAAGMNMYASSRAPFDPTERGVATLWDARTGVERYEFPAVEGAIYGVAFSSDSRWLAAGGADGMVRIWDIRDPARKARELPRRHKGMVKHVMFLPDGRLVSAGGSSIGSEFGEVKIWDVPTERDVDLLDLRGHTQMVQALACSPDGRRLATGSLDFTIKLWDTTTGEEVFTLRGHTAGVLRLAFSPNGRRIASGSIDRTVRVWDTSEPTAGALIRREAESRVQVSELPADPFAH
jgi:WD40 repeat protein